MLKRRMAYIMISPEKKEKYTLPPIGMRIVKSAIGVFLCYIVNLLRGGMGIVFYSQLAVLWCIQDYVSETKSRAKQRAIGTMIGAIWGLIIILLRATINKYIYQMSDIIYGIIISLSIVLVLYSTVVLKKKQASYFSCVVFLSIVVSHITDDNPYIFVFNRFLDTMIGILIGVFVNCFELPREKHKDILFLSGLDDTLLAPNGTMSDYSKVELNRMIEDGAQFTISTIRTPASLMEPLRNINLKLPVIAMDGAALYNIKENAYEHVYVISPENSKLIKEYLSQNEIPFFANVIIDDLLIIYYQHTNHAGYNELIQKLKASPYRNYINRQVPDDESVVYYMVIDSESKIKELYDRMVRDDFLKKYKIVIQKSLYLNGYAMLKIYNHNATKENMIDYLKKKVNTSRFITFGTIEGKYDYIIKPGDFNKVVKYMRKEYEPVKVKNR